MLAGIVVAWSRASVVLHLRVFLDQFDALVFTMELVLKDSSAPADTKKQAEEYQVRI
jgi:hypothetical protein